MDMTQPMFLMDCTKTDDVILQSREWLVTNGIGGFAMGTVSGAQTRRYHALLIAALKPPLDRKVMLSAIEEHTLSSRDDRSTIPLKHHLIQFHLEGTIPVWTFEVEGRLMEKRIWMEHGMNQTCIQYALEAGIKPLPLRIDTYVHHRDFHQNQRGDAWQNRVEPQDNGFRYDAHPDAASLHVCCDRANFTVRRNWVHDLPQSVETYRGLDDRGSHFHAGTLTVELVPGSPVTLVASAHTPTTHVNALDAHRNRDASLIRRSGLADEPRWIQHLALAADQFIVKRVLPREEHGLSVIAGYPWFGDWGRDTMICLPGLLLSTGRIQEAGLILRTFSRYVDQGMLPNRFPDDSGPPEYNTVDATLWYFDAIRAYLKASQDVGLLEDLYPTLLDILEWHRRGTRFGIGVDPEDGLLRAGEPGVQLTWMDAKVDDWVVTPRMGKPVEINALWYHTLNCMAEFSQILSQDSAFFLDEAKQVRKQFQRFWNPETRCCYDLIDTPEGDSGQIRPNQIFAVALDYSPLTPEQQKAVVDTCMDRLLTPRGLRSLSPEDEAYHGVYGGDRHERDGAYHQGTVWGWLIGPFVRAHLRVYRDAEKACHLLLPFADHLAEAGIGSMSEIFDGDPPHASRGCPAQAWSVAEILRTWLFLSPRESQIKI